MKKSRLYHSLDHRLLIVFILILSLTSACKLINKKPDVTLYRSAWNNEIEKFSFINLDEFNNFDSLLNKVDAVRCEDSIPVLELINEQKFKYIPLIASCGYRNGHARSRNSFWIVDEQYFRGKEISTQDSISYFLDQFIRNPDKRSDCSDNPKRALIIIGYSEKGIQGLSQFLDRLTDAADTKDLTENLNIYLRKPFPPPPPPLKKISD